MLEEISESFLDDVFGSSGKLPRKEYTKIIATSQNWIFNSKEIRDRVNKKISG